MRPFVNRVVSLLIMFFLSIGAIAEVEANRRDGSDSFENETLQSNPNNRSYSRQTPRQQHAVIQNQRIRQSLARRGRFMARLGGITLGGLLGVLVFGGAFENLKAIDFAVFGLIALVFYKFNAGRMSQ